MTSCADCDCADPTALTGLSADCSCGCHRVPAPTPGLRFLGTDAGYVVVANNVHSRNVVSEHETYPEAVAAQRACEYRDETFYTVHGCCPRSMDRAGYCAGAL